MINHIYDFHKKVKENPKQFCKKIHAVVLMIEKLLKRKEIEFKENDVIAFNNMTELFCHWKGSRKKIELDCIQKFIVAVVMGIKIQNKDGEWVRYFRECRVFVAKKFGKSVLMSLFAVWFLLFDREDGAEIYCVATKKEQSKIVFDNIDKYIKQNKEISKLAVKKYSDGTHYISCAENDGVIKYLSASKKGLQGKNSSLCLFDELQEVTDMTIFEAIRTGMATRKQPLFVSMSTAGVTANSAYNFMYSQIEEMIEQKKFDDEARVFFAVFEIDIDDDISDKTKWIKANPALLDGRPTLEHLEKEYSLALLGAEQKSMPAFIAFHLNRSCDEALSFYDTNITQQALCEFGIDMVQGHMAYGGVDLASYADFAVATLIVPFKHIADDTFDIYVFQKYFKAENRLERDSESDKVVYKNFMHTKSKNPLCVELLQLCKGDTNNFADIAEWFRMLRDEFGVLIRKVGYDDQYYGAPFIQEMQNRGFSVEQVDFSTTPPKVDGGHLSKVRSGTHLSDMIKLSKILFEQKRIKIDSENKMLCYNLSNVKVTIDKDNRYAIVKKIARGRIDGAWAFLASLRVFYADKENLLHLLQYDNINKYQ